MSILTRWAVMPQALSSFPSSCRNVVFRQRGQAGSFGPAVESSGSLTYGTSWFELDESARVQTAWVSELNLGPNIMLFMPLYL